MKIYNDPTYDILTIKVNKEEVRKAFLSYENFQVFEEELIKLIEREVQHDS